MAISWACRLSVSQYAATGRRASAPRQSCPGCGDEMSFDGSYRRRDSTAAVGVAVLGYQVPVGAGRFYDGVPGRTVRSWHQRFAERADVLAGRFAAVCVEWGDLAPRPADRTVGVAIEMIGVPWRAASRRRPGPMPPAWFMANVVVGGELLGTRVNLPGPAAPKLVGHARVP